MSTLLAFTGCLVTGWLLSTWALVIMVGHPADVAMWRRAAKMTGAIAFVLALAVGILALMSSLTT